MIRPKRAALACTVCFAAVFAVSAASGDKPTEVRVPAPAHGGQTASEGLIVLADAALQQLVVVDPKARLLILYAVSGTATRPVIVRDLDADLFSSDVAPVPVIPAADVPGSDLDGVPRPDKAVRVGFSHDAAAGSSGTWTVDYVVAGALPELYESIRSTLDDWTLVSERVSTTSRVAGTMKFESGPRKLTVVVRGYQPGYQQVRYQLIVP